jgi:RNA polymerase sigma-70 factor, ECF subfamily
VSNDDITRLLHHWSTGTPEALNRLVPVVYADLRRMARQALRHERGPHTLQPTALVHEAFLRLLPQQKKDWQNREHFFAVCAQLMRHVLVDHARRHRAKKRGAGDVRLALDDLPVRSSDDPLHAVDLLELDRALSRLAEIDTLRARVVEMRYFAGMTLQEIGSVSGRPVWAVKKDWTLAKAWLKHQLRQTV